jgi:hypothetical protein
VQKVVAPDGVIVAVGVALTVKVPALVPVPDALVTLMSPVTVPTAGVAVIVVLFTTVKDAAARPLNLTATEPVKLVPVIVTSGRLPEQPEVGVKLVIVGAIAFASIVLSANSTKKHTRRVTGTTLTCLF